MKKITGMIKTTRAIIVSRLVRVPEEEKERRLAICANCGNFRSGFCEICGCEMGLKSRFSASECPIDKW